MCRRIFLSVLFFTAVLLLKVDFFDSYALPLKGDIEVQTEDGSNTVEAPGIIVIQDTISGEDGLETEGLQDNKDDRINKAAQEKQTGKDVPLQDSSQGADFIQQPPEKNPAACLKSLVIAAVNCVPVKTILPNQGPLPGQIIRLLLIQTCFHWAAGFGLERLFI